MRVEVLIVGANKNRQTSTCMSHIFTFESGVLEVKCWTNRTAMT